MVTQDRRSRALRNSREQDANRDRYARLGDHEDQPQLGAGFLSPTSSNCWASSFLPPPCETSCSGRNREIRRQPRQPPKGRKRSQNPARFPPGIPIMCGPSTPRKSRAGACGRSRSSWPSTISPARSCLWRPWKDPMPVGSSRLWTSDLLLSPGRTQEDPRPPATPVPRTVAFGQAFAANFAASRRSRPCLTGTTGSDTQANLFTGEGGTYPQ